MKIRASIIVDFDFTDAMADELYNSPEEARRWLDGALRARGNLGYLTEHDYLEDAEFVEVVTIVM